MKHQQVVDILQELLAAEQCSLVPRLTESTVFVSHSSLEVHSAVEKIAAVRNEHGARLSEMIIELSGSLIPRTGCVTTADLHFQELHRLLPRLVVDQESLISRYESAATHLAGAPAAAALAADIVASHREELDLLRGLSGSKPAGAS